MIEFHALGGLSVTADGQDLAIGGPRQRRLLAMLLIHRGAVVSVDRLAEAVFAGEPTPAASTTLRSYVARIRRVLDAGASATVITKAPGYELRLPADGFDVARFEGLLDESGKLLTRGDPAAAAAAVGRALALWRGAAYGEFADEDWARPEAQRLEELRLVANDRLLEAELACGRAAAVVGAAEVLVGEHPLRESFWTHLLVALVRAGRQPEALRACRQQRRVLGEELGLDPSPAMVELERRVAAHDPTLLAIEPTGQPLRGYRLGERLGSGPLGTMFAAHIPGETTDVTVRIVPATLADDPDFVRKFDADAQRVAALGDRGVVPLVDHWREPGAAFVVLRRMHGGNLADRLVRGPLDAALVARIARRVGAALEACAAQGIVHGCVGPDTVVFDLAGQPFLADVPIGTRPRDRTAADDRRAFVALLRRCVRQDDPVAVELARADASDGAGVAEVASLVVDGLATTPADRPLPRYNPYKGLRAFDEPDAADFFGRTGLLDELVTRLSGDDLRARMILLVGGSGTGKSSAVRAGLLPRVRAGDVPGSDRWFVTTVLPGSAPFKELAEALGYVAVGDPADLAERLAADDGAGIDQVLADVLPEGGGLLLVVDQLEELFTMASDADQRRFLNGLVGAATAPAGRLRVVATLRADYFDRPLAVTGFADVVDATTVTVAAMAPSEVEAAIVEPACRAGLAVERALVTELVNAVVDQPAALPSLQYALYELVERSAGRELTLAAYRQVGGLAGAITARAETLYQSLDDDQRAAVRQAFERLVVVHHDGEPTRRRAQRAELVALGDGPTLNAVIDRWAEARLLTLDRDPASRAPTVEVAHEALLREWDRLRSWIDEDRGAIVAMGQLYAAAAAWEELDRDPGSLYRGTRLGLALDVTERRGRKLPPLEEAFLAASTAARDAEQREVAARVERQARSNRRLRIQLGVVGVALVVALTAGLWALDRGRAASHERTVARARELAAAANASLGDDPERSIHLALAAVETARTDASGALPEATSALHRAVTSSRAVRTFAGLGGWLDWSPDGTTFVTEGPEKSGLIDIRDAETGTSLRSWKGHDDDVNQVAFSPDGTRLATAGDDGALRVWDPMTGALAWEFVDGEHASAFAPTFTPDGRHVLASWPGGGPVRTFDAASGTVLGESASADVLALSASPDGQRVAFGQWDVRGVADGARGEVLTLLGESGSRSVEWSPDGTLIAVGTFDGTVGLWSPEGARLEAATGHVGEVLSIDWSPDSTRLVTGGQDGTVRMWTVADDGLREELVLSATAADAGVASVAFSPDGMRVMAGAWTMGAVTVWDVSEAGAGEWINTRAARGNAFALGALASTPDGHGFVVADDEGGAVGVDVATGRRTTLLDRAGEVLTQIRVSADGERLAVSAGSAPHDVIDIPSQRRVGGLAGVDGLNELAWSGDGAVLAAAIGGPGDVGTVAVFDRDGSELARYEPEPDTWVLRVAISPDGRLIAMSRNRFSRSDPEMSAIIVWDWRADEVVATMPRNDIGPAALAFDPTGTRLVAGMALGGGGDVWDVVAGERVVTLAGAPLVADVAFSPDGSTIATGHADGVVRLWDAETGVRRLELLGSGASADRVVFSADGSQLASLSSDGLLRVWAVDLDDLVAIAAGRITRPLSDDECRQYLHVDRCSS